MSVGGPIVDLRKFFHLQLVLADIWHFTLGDRGLSISWRLRIYFYGKNNWGHIVRCREAVRILESPLWEVPLYSIKGTPAQLCHVPHSDCSLRVRYGRFHCIQLKAHLLNLCHVPHSDCLLILYPPLGPSC